MSETSLGLPKGWDLKKLEQVATLQRGFDLPGTTRAVGSVPVIASNGVDGSHNVAQCKGPGVITGRSGTIGNVHFVDSEYWPLNTTLYVRDFHGNSPRYIAYLLEFLNLAQYAAATGVPSLNRNFIHPLPIKNPPLAEQRRIAEILSTLDEQIEQTEALVEKEALVRTAILTNMVRASNAPSITINELASKVGSGVTPTGGSEIYKTSGITFVRSQNVLNEQLDLTDVAYITDEIHTGMAGSRLEDNDVLLNITGASIGRCCCVPPRSGEANVNQHVCIIRLNYPNEADAQLMAALICSEFGQRELTKQISGGNREGLNYQQVRAMSIPWPVLSGTRAKMAAVLESAKLSIAALEAKAAKLKVQKQGLMHDLLTGKVRVNQLEKYQ